MSGYYGVVLPAYFTGQTGRAVQKRGGKNAQLLGLFLLANEWMNMLGLYKLRLADVHDILELTPTAARRAYEALEAERYAFFDEATSYVWVKEMARIRLGLTDHQPLSPKDKRAIGAARLYSGLPPNPFLGPFHDRYGSQLLIKVRRDGPARSGGENYPFEGASKGLRRGIEGASKPVTDPDQGTEQGSGAGTAEREKQSRAARATTPPASSGNSESLLELAREAIGLEGDTATKDHLVDAVSSLCLIRGVGGIRRGDISAAIELVIEERVHG